MTMWDPTGSWCHAIHSKFLTAIHGAGWDPILSHRILQDPINIRSCVRCLPWIDVLTLVKSVDEIVRYDLLNKSCRVALSCCAVLFLRSFAKWYLGSFLLFWPWTSLGAKVKVWTFLHRSISKGIQWLPWTLWGPSAGLGCDWSDSRPRCHTTALLSGNFLFEAPSHSTVARHPRHVNCCCS